MLNIASIHLKHQSDIANMMHPLIILRTCRTKLRLPALAFLVTRDALRCDAMPVYPIAIGHTAHALQKKHYVASVVIEARPEPDAVERKVY